MEIAVKRGLAPQDASRKVRGAVRWSGWKALPVLAGLLFATPGCSKSDSPSDGCYETETDSGSKGCYCVYDGSGVVGTLTNSGTCSAGKGQNPGECPAKGQCVDKDEYALLNPDSPTDSVMVVGNYSIRLDLTDTYNGVQSVTIDILDNCGAVLQNATITSGDSKAFSEESGNVWLIANIGSVSAGTPRSVQVSVSIRCGADSGLIDAGQKSDAGPDADAGQ